MKKKKASVISDTFETIGNVGKGVGEGAIREVLQALNPLEQSSGLNHTPLDTKELEKNFQKQDEQKMANLRIHLFQRVKEGERQIVQDRKRKMQEREQVLAREVEEKKRKEEEKRKMQQVEPEGKKRRFLFSPKRKAREQHPETKPSVGKQ